MIPIKITNLINYLFFALFPFESVNVLRANNLLQATSVLRAFLQAIGGLSAVKGLITNDFVAIEVAFCGPFSGRFWRCEGPIASFWRQILGQKAELFFGRLRKSERNRVARQQIFSGSVGAAFRAAGARALLPKHRFLVTSQARVRKMGRPSLWA
jgi:hypothetical protein